MKLFLFSGPPNPRPALPSYQPRAALPSSPTPIVVRNEPSGGGCFGCDDDYKWYDLEGKGTYSVEDRLCFELELPQVAG